MITLKIENKEYECPSSYEDFTLGEFKALHAWLELEHIKPKVDKVVNGEVDDEEEALNFYIDFINRVANIPKKLLMQVKPYGDDQIEELSIQWVFESISFLLCMPVIEEPKPLEKIGDLHFIDKIDLTQAIFKDLVFVEYNEAKSVSRAFNNLKDEGRLEYLNLLLAIMYRPKEVTGKWLWKKEVIEQYDSEKVKARAEWFDSLDMDTVWNCLFFFMQLKTNSLRNIELSLKEEVVKARQG